MKKKLAVNVADSYSWRMLKRWINEERGRAARLSRLLGVSHVSVSRWTTESDAQRVQIPANHCPQIEVVTGIPAEALRPDVKWKRIRCKGWPNGKPLIDVQTKEPA